MYTSATDMPVTEKRVNQTFLKQLFAKIDPDEDEGNNTSNPSIVTGISLIDEKDENQEKAAQIRLKMEQLRKKAVNLNIANSKQNKIHNQNIIKTKTKIHKTQNKVKDNTGMKWTESKTRHKKQTHHPLVDNQSKSKNKYIERYAASKLNRNKLLRTDKNNQVLHTIDNTLQSDVNKNIRKHPKTSINLLEQIKAEEYERIKKEENIEKIKLLEKRN